MVSRRSSGSLGWCPVEGATPVVALTNFDEFILLFLLIFEDLQKKFSNLTSFIQRLIGMFHKHLKVVNTSSWEHMGT